MKFSFESHILLLELLKFATSVFCSIVHLPFFAFFHPFLLHLSPSLLFIFYYVVVIVNLCHGNVKHLLFTGILASIWKIFCSWTYSKFCDSQKKLSNIEFYNRKMKQRGMQMIRGANIKCSHLVLGLSYLYNMSNVQERDDYALELAMGDE